MIHHGTFFMTGPLYMFTVAYFAVSSIKNLKILSFQIQNCGTHISYIIN